MKTVSIDDYRVLARRRLPRFLFDYIDGGAYGRAGVAHVLETLAAEMRVTMALAGVTRPDQIDSSVLFPAGANRAA